MVEARTQRFPALDGVRALAAFGVVLTHVGFTTSRSVQPDLFGAVIARGDFGVTVFFLLSGFLLYRPFAMRSFDVGPRPLVAEYLWRRALRILPALWLMTAITLAFVTTFRVRAIDWMQYLLLIQTYDHHDYDPNLSQLWTLVVEVSFYALLPLLAAAVGGPARGPDSVLRRQAVMLGMLFAAALAFNIVVSYTSLTQTQALLWLPAYLDWFGAGMALAIISAVPAGTRALAGPRETLRIWAANRSLCWLIAATLFLISTLPLGIPRTLAPATFWEWTTQHYVYGGAAFFIMLPLVAGRGVGLADALLGSRLARLFGNLSYSIYLWHVPVMLWLQRHLGYRQFHGNFWPLLVSTTAVTIAIAAASWYLVEQPILRYGSRPWRGAADAARTPAASAARHSS
jgi:peptidoglycan/LPS O-acetylase OafA/YrhL